MRPTFTNLELVQSILESPLSDQLTVEDIVQTVKELKEFINKIREQEGSSEA